MVYFKNNKGSAFMIVIISMAVLLILATTIASIAASNFEMSHAERRYQAAYYVAEAGIRHQIEHMRLRMEWLHSRAAPPISAGAFFEDFNGQIADAPLILRNLTAAPLIMQNLGNDIARADLSMSSPPLPHSPPPIPNTGNPREYWFESLATVGNVSRELRGSVTIEWAQTDFFRLALFTRGNLTISGNPTITGGIGTNAASVTIPEIVYTNMNLPMPAIVLPQNLPLRNDLNIKNKDVEPVDASGEYSSIDVKGTLLFDLTHGDLLILVNNLKMNNGVIKTIGTGRLYLFVNGDLSLAGNDRINEEEEREDNMVMFVTGDSIDIRGNAVFAGGLYAPNALVYLTGGQFTGGITANEIRISGNPNIRHVPITPTGISSHLGPIPPVLTINPWREPELR